MKDRKIHILDPAVIQKIAAGEVVESGASVIKELIENSIDAGSTHLVIETTSAGKTEIKVSDNGCGMSPEDLTSSILRHATSKIKDSEDLFRLSTMGFRGEALYAIAAVSKLTLISTALGETVGTKLQVEGGKILRTAPASRSHGTTVIVSSLFFNTPARKAFQKEDAIELQAIRKGLIQASLCYLNCGFEWIDQGKSIFSFPAALSLDERGELLLGQEFRAGCETIAAKHQDFSLSGLISRPDHHRPNRRGQTLFINRRPINSPLIVEAVEEAFRFRLPEARFPLFVLHLTLPSDLIDANVHPQKREVRLREERKIFDWVKKSVASLLDKREPPMSLSLSDKELELPSDGPYLCPPPPLLEIESEKIEEPSLPLHFSHRFLLTSGDLLFFECEGALLLVHAKRALERLLFDRKEKSFSIGFTQKLLFPLFFEVGQEEEALFLDHLTLLESMGIVLRQMGKRSFLLEAAPAGFEEKEKILSLISDLKLNEMEEKRAALAARVAKVTTFTFSTEEGARKLMEALSQEVEKTTPSGKRISLLLTEEKLLKLL